MSALNYNYLFKFIVIGDTCIYLLTIVVGKSNLLMQYTHKKFKKEHEITIGVEFTAKNIIVDDNNVRVQIWDTVI
jgi:Ras-related protein Rab-2A